jgi:hypothetical protein
MYDNINPYLFLQIGDSKLRVSEVKVDKHADKTFWRVDLRDDLLSGKTAVVSIIINNKLFSNVRCTVW